MFYDGVECVGLCFGGSSVVICCSVLLELIYCGVLLVICCGVLLVMVFYSVELVRICYIVLVMGGFWDGVLVVICFCGR